ncbi:MAG TPA: carbohydrate ABC transporter permease [Aggregatilineales bacterium]|nr:carbohydrate ABC transporter permease [Aggregatilineales bacterium]
MVASVNPRKRFNQALLNLLAWVIVLVTLFPAVWVVLTAIRPYSEINAVPVVWIPREITFEAYVNMFGGNPDMVTQAPIGRYALNSIIVALFSTIFAVALGTAAGYAFSRFRFRGHTTIFLGMMLARAIPGIALGLPLFVLFSRLGMLNQLSTLIIINVALNIPFTAWLMDGFFRTIPADLDESAYIDGASHWQAFWLINLPLARSGMAAAAVFAFLASWNEFQIVSIISRSPEGKTFTVGLLGFIQTFTSDWRGMAALSALMMIPALIFVVLAQRHMVRGLTFGAVKG